MALNYLAPSPYASPVTRDPSCAWTADPRPLRCARCHGALQRAEAGFNCYAEGCGASLPLDGGVLVVRDTATDDNKTAADFYNSKLWPKVRFWERIFWAVNGGERRARDVVLRHLPKSSGVRLLDVAIGDGVYTSWLPEDWSIVGIDVSATQLAACQRKNAGRNLQLVLGEAEDMPFGDEDVRRRAEQRRVQPFQRPRGGAARDGAGRQARRPVVIADEMPNFLNFGHRLGLPGLDRWIGSRLMSMGDDFAGLVERHRNIDIAEIGRRVLDDSRYEVIWRGGGYLMVGRAPECQSARKFGTDALSMTLVTSRR